MNQNILLKCDQRLGDIVLCEPIARHFADQGFTVYFQTLAQYRSLFERIEAATWIGPEGAKLIDFEQEHELSIWPDSYDDYRKSGTHYVDYLYRNFREINDRTPKLIAKEIEAPEFILAPYGISGAITCSIADILRAMNSIRPAVILWDGTNYTGLPPIHRPNMVCYDIPHLIDTVHSAIRFATVNTATSIIASAVRQRYTHVNLTGPHSKQDNYLHFSQHRITV